MASDLISREAVLKELGESLQAVKGSTKWMMGTQQGLENAVVMVKEAPAVDAEPVRHGEWRTFNVPKKWNGATLRCSECNTGTTWRWNYCPNCGAKMDGGAENATV